MKYDRIRKAVFIERPNRFIAHVDLEGKRETVHVKNTGRCAELLVPGTEVYIQESSLSEDNAADFTINLKETCIPCFLSEYYGAAEPPVRCGESHLSGLTEPPHFIY